MLSPRDNNRSDCGAVRAKTNKFHHFLTEKALDMHLFAQVEEGDKLSDYEQSKQNRNLHQSRSSRYRPLLTCS
jgi:hypothetical protein